MVGLLEVWLVVGLGLGLWEVGLALGGSQERC